METPCRYPCKSNLLGLVFYLSLLTPLNWLPVNQVLVQLYYRELRSVERFTNSSAWQSLRISLPLAVVYWNPDQAMDLPTLW